MKQLSELLFDRSLVAHVKNVFSFDQMKEAYVLMKSYKTVGKIVIKF
jgi:NADPH:quinone reductase-like Zn-dependent oxidoreductase